MDRSRQGAWQSLFLLSWLAHISTAVDVEVTPFAGTILLQHQQSFKPALTADLDTAIAIDAESDAEPPRSAPASGGSFSEYFNSHHDGHGMNKWIHYFPAYQRHFARFIGQDVHIVEIGVQSGGSLDMWRAIFGPRAHVYGVDIDPNVTFVSGNATQVFVGDQAKQSFWDRFKQVVPRVDILIDDGGHTPEMQTVTLGEMLPYLSPNGVYMTEDVHGENNSFWQMWNLRSKYRSPTGIEYPPLNQWVGSVHVYPYLLVLEREPASPEALQLHLGEKPSEVYLHADPAHPREGTTDSSVFSLIAPGVKENTDIAFRDVLTEFAHLAPNGWLAVPHGTEPFAFGHAWEDGTDNFLKMMLNMTKRLHAPEMGPLHQWVLAGGQLNNMQKTLDSLHMYPGLMILQKSDGSRDRFGPQRMGTVWVR